MFKVLLVQVNFLSVPIFIKLCIRFWHLRDEVIQCICCSLLLFFHFAVVTLVLIDVLRILTRRFTLSVPLILKDEVWRQLLLVQRSALLLPGLILRRVEVVLKLLAVTAFFDVLSLLLL